MANPKGTPVWFELNTPDADAAQDFYAAVAGWDFAASPVPEHGDYRMGGPGKTGVAGLMRSSGEGGGFPGWAIYFASDDVDADAARVAQLGGTVHFGPADIPHVGRFAMVGDPQGVVFSLMKGASSEDSRAFAQVGGAGSVGHGVWIEIATPDPDGAFDFYGKLFGWTKGGAMPMGEMGEYAFIAAAGPATGPGAVMSSEKTGAPARWSWYIHVSDIDDAVATATEKGGTLLHGPDQIPGGDYSANLADPQGFQIGLVGPRK